MLLFLKEEVRCGTAVCFESGESDLTNSSNHYSKSNYTRSRTKVNVAQPSVSNSSQNRCLGRAQEHINIHDAHQSTLLGFTFT